MGQLLSLISGSDNAEKVFIDFEKATPSDDEKALHDEVAEVLNKAPVILDRLRKYAGCEEYIRKAITTPGPETEDAAWEAVLPAVDQLQQFYDFSLELEQRFPKLLVALCKNERGGEKAPRNHLSNMQALAKQLADVFDFVLRFDDAKMVNPAIQNDFSYYRRTLNRMKLSKKDANIKIRDELANRMSLFFAYPTPMMKVLSETTAKFLSTDVTVPRENVTSVLATLAKEHSLMSTGSYFLLFSSSAFLLILLSFSVEKSHALETRETIESHFHTLQLSSLLPSSSCNPATKGKRRGASLEVVNRQGPCTLLNQKGAKAPTLTEILAHDQARVDSIQARITDQSYDLFKKKDKKSSNKKKSVKDSKANLPAQSGLPLGTGNYIVNVGLGTPKKDLSLIFDTGSDLTWTQCQPCVKSCYAQQQPIFDPSTSKTYSNISCTSAACSSLKSATGNSPGCSSSNCVYGIQYGDSSFTIGFFAKDKLTLTQNDVFDGFMFGCGQNNKGLFGKTAGLIGLGRDPLSIVQQTAQKFGKYFSYCLPTSRGSNGHLTFGNGNGVKASKAVKNGITFTPFASSQGTAYYFIDVLGISVGGKALSISPMLFQNAGTIIDSGTVITRLPSTAYGSLKSAFKQFMSKYPTAPALSLLDTCYDLSNYTSISIPKISFNFNGNANVELDPNGILITNGASQVCLAFAGNGDDDSIGIFGNIQQQTLEVVYDVAGGQLGFGYKGCS